MNSYSMQNHNPTVPSQRHHSQQGQQGLPATASVNAAQYPSQQPQPNRQIPARYRGRSTSTNPAFGAFYNNPGGRAVMDMTRRPSQPVYSRPALPADEVAQGRVQHGARPDIPPPRKHSPEAKSCKSRSSNQSEEIQLLRGMLSNLGIGQRQISHSQAGLPQRNPGYGQQYRPQAGPQQGERYGYQYGQQSPQYQHWYGQHYGGQYGWQHGPHCRPHTAYRPQHLCPFTPSYQPQHQGHEAALRMPPFGGQQCIGRDAKVPLLRQDPELVRRIMDWMENVELSNMP